MTKGKCYMWKKTSEVFHFVDVFDYEHGLGIEGKIKRKHYILMTPVSRQPWVLTEQSIKRMDLVEVDVAEFIRGDFYSNDKLVDKARKLATKWSVETNHLYDHDEENGKYGVPYTYHTHSVKDEVLKYAHLLPQNKVDIAISAAYLHDSGEDERVTYNDVKEEVGEEVASIVFAVTNNWGLNRKQRADESYYARIRSVGGATYLKICDRLANVRKGFEDKSSMLKKYAKEQENFRSSLRTNDYSVALMELEKKKDKLVRNKMYQEASDLRNDVEKIKQRYFVEKDWYEEMWNDLEKMLKA